MQRTFLLWSVTSVPFIRACNRPLGLVRSCSLRAHNMTPCPAGVVQLVPVLFFVGYECWLVYAVYATVLSEYNVLDKERVPREDPIQERRDGTVMILANCGTMLTNVFLLIFTTSLILYVGGVFKTEPIRDQVCSVYLLLHLCTPAQCNLPLAANSVRMCIIQGQWLTRAITFIGVSAVFALCTMVPLMVYLPYASLFISSAVFAVMRLLQIAVIPRMLKHTHAMSDMVPYEMVILVTSCLVLLVSLVQLALTPIIFTGGSCNCSWDEYPTWVRVFQWAGSGVNVGASIMAATASIGNFLNNTTSFNVRSSCLSVLQTICSACAAGK